MITRRYVLLVVSNKPQLEFCERFEALLPITELKAEIISEVWRKNKIPVILKKQATDIDCNIIPVVELPDKIWTREKESIEEFEDFCHMNLFECGEYRTGLQYDTAKERCFLCELANHKGMLAPLSDYNEHIEDEVDCIIYESPRFYIVPELGSILPGYLMIVPKNHYLSVAQMPTTLMNEYRQVCEDIEWILNQVYEKEVTFFEHGSGPSGLTSHKKSIVHAHTHLVAGFKLAYKYQNMVQLKPIDDIATAKENHYFSYQEGTTGQLMICMDPEVYVQRQFPRQVMAEELGLAPGQYNWRNVKFSENVKATLYRVHKFLKTQNVPARIRERTIGFVEGYERREDYRLV